MAFTQPVELTAPERLLTDSELTEQLGLRKGCLGVWRHRKVGPPYIQLGPKSPRYSPSAVAAWLASRNVEVKP